PAARMARPQDLGVGPTAPGPRPSERRAEPVSDLRELQWNEWSAPSRAKIERTGVHLFTKAFRDANPVYHSESLAQEAGFADVPCPPTYTFVMAHGGGWPDLQPEAPKVAIEEN